METDPAIRGEPMYRVAERLRSTSSQDGTIVLDIEHGQIFRLNATGALIFGCLQEGRSHAEIVTALTAETGVTQETAANDVDDFLQALGRVHLVCRGTPEEKS